MGVGSLWGDLLVWGFRTFVFTGLSTAITLLVLTARSHRRVQHRMNSLCEPIEWKVTILQPDDIGHPYALIRAWDRHLVCIGLPPIGDGEPAMLNSWKVSDPDADVWWIDNYGRADTRPYKTLLQTELRKAPDTSGE